MSTRSRIYQDPRHLQLWFTFEWPVPTDPVPVSCVECAWHGRRQRSGATSRPCPRCGASVSRCVQRRIRRARQPAKTNVVRLPTAVTQ